MRRHTLAALAALVALPALVGAERDAAAAKPRCLWAKRDCYPPANLWYRVRVEFTGDLVRRSVEGSMPTWERTTRLEWTLESNTAVRLRLMCDDMADNAGPFLVKRTIQGVRRTIGGCGRGARRDLFPSLSFAAKGTGELTRWTNSETGGPVDGPGSHCDGFTVTAQAPRQELSGAVQSVGGSAASIEIGVRAAGRVVPPTGSTPYTCTNTITGQTSTRSATGLAGACCHIFGSTGWYQRDGILGWKRITDHLRFSPTAARFGGRLWVLHDVDQDEITEDRPALPPPGAAWLREEQHYYYKILFVPCPNHGLDVARCDR
jgi:hypothetical protein